MRNVIKQKKVKNKETLISIVQGKMSRPVRQRKPAEVVNMKDTSKSTQKNPRAPSPPTSSAVAPTPQRQGKTRKSDEHQHPSHEVQSSGTPGMQKVLSLLNNQMSLLTQLGAKVTALENFANTHPPARRLHLQHSFRQQLLLLPPRRLHLQQLDLPPHRLRSLPLRLPPDQL